MQHHLGAATKFREILDARLDIGRREHFLGKTEEWRSSLEFERSNKADKQPENWSAPVARRIRQTSLWNDLPLLLLSDTQDRCQRDVQHPLSGFQTWQIHWHVPHRKTSISRLLPSLGAVAEVALCYEPQSKSEVLRAIAQSLSIAGLGIICMLIPEHKTQFYNENLNYFLIDSH